MKASWTSAATALCTVLGVLAAAPAAYAATFRGGPGDVVFSQVAPSGDLTLTGTYSCRGYDQLHMVVTASRRQPGGGSSNEHTEISVPCPAVQAPLPLNGGAQAAIEGFTLDWRAGLQTAPTTFDAAITRAYREGDADLHTRGATGVNQVSVGATASAVDAGIKITGTYSCRYDLTAQIYAEALVNGQVVSAARKNVSCPTSGPTPYELSIPPGTS